MLTVLIEIALMILAGAGLVLFLIFFVLDRLFKKILPKETSNKQRKVRILVVVVGLIIFVIAASTFNSLLVNGKLPFGGIS